MIPDAPPPSWIVTIAMPALTLIAGVIVARVTARGNQRVTEIERELPPYEALAKRTSDLEALVKTMEKESREERDQFGKRTECLEDAVEELRDALDEDREWIKRVIVVAEQRGAIEHIAPLPDWLDLGSESMRQQRRRQIGPGPYDSGQPDDDR